MSGELLGGLRGPEATVSLGGLGCWEGALRQYPPGVMFLTFPRKTARARIAPGAAWRCPWATSHAPAAPLRLAPGGSLRRLTCSQRQQALHCRSSCGANRRDLRAQGVTGGHARCLVRCWEACKGQKRGSASAASAFQRLPHAEAAVRPSRIRSRMSSYHKMLVSHVWRDLM
jgi:hypothetical protein